MMNVKQYEERIRKNKKDKQKTLYLINVHYIGEIAYAMIAFDMMIVVLLQILQTWARHIAWVVFSMYIVEILKYCFIIHVVICVIIIGLEKRCNIMQMQKYMQKKVYRIRGDRCFEIILIASLIALGMVQVQEMLKTAYLTLLDNSSIINAVYYTSLVIEMIMFMCIISCILLWVKCPAIPMKSEGKDTNVEQYLALEKEQIKAKIDTKNMEEALELMKNRHEKYQKEKMKMELEDHRMENA